MQMCQFIYWVVTVTVTEAFILHPLLEDRGQITEQISLFLGVDIHIQTGTFSVDVERMHLSYTAVSGLLAACFMLAVQQQKKLCC